MKAFRIAQTFLLSVILLQSLAATACIWDSDTLLEEKWKSPDLAKVIFAKDEPKVKRGPLDKKIKQLTANPRENDPAWWNELAGAYLRLGNPAKAAELLEKVVERFPNDYGIHANLGTAYHLLGRYAEAEKEIARDLEINPDAHFGLEKYHLALLQYLVRDAKYQSRHVYVDEFTASFLQTSHAFFYFRDYFEERARDFSEIYTNGVDEMLAEYESLSETNRSEAHFRGQILSAIALFDAGPAYREKWNLAEDSRLQEGVVYMASLNPKEPACFVMLGIVSWKKRDLNLTVAAFKKAIQLGSPQSEILQNKIDVIQTHIKKARAHSFGFWGFLSLACLIVIIAYCLSRRRARRRRLVALASDS